MEVHIFNNIFFLEILKFRLKEIVHKLVTNDMYTTTLTNSDFENLEKIISTRLKQENVLTDKNVKELGTSVDVSSLKRIFNDPYFLTENFRIDVRKRKTLDKICIFLGYFSWNDFVSYHNDLFYVSELNQIKPPASEVPKIIHLIHHFKEAEFKQYLLTLDEGGLDFENGKLEIKLKDPWGILLIASGLDLSNFVSKSNKFEMDIELERIVKEYNLRRQMKCYINQTDGYSKYDIQDIKMVFLSSSQAIVKVTEIWTLKWNYKYLPAGDLCDIVDERKNKIYFIEKRNDFWVFNNKKLANPECLNFFTKISKSE